MSGTKHGIDSMRQLLQVTLAAQAAAISFSGRGQRRGDGTTWKRTGLVPGWLPRADLPPRNLSQMKANDVGCPTFNGKCSNYPRLRKEWRACRQPSHNFLGDDLMAKVLREKYISNDIRVMIDNTEDLDEMWSTLDSCYPRPEVYS